MHCWFCGLMVRIVGKQSGQNSIYSIHLIRQELWKSLNLFLQYNGLKVKLPLATPFPMKMTEMTHILPDKADMFLAYATVPGYR